MKCWAVQKFLPLYVGEDDLPLGKHSIQKHLDACATCKDAYQSYLVPKKILEERKLDNLPPAFFQNYWTELSAKLPAETQPKPDSMASSLRLWHPALAAAVVMFAVGTFAFWKEYTASEGRSSFFQANPSYSTAISGKNPFASGRKEALEPISYKLHPAFIEYDLDEVSPLSYSQDASF